MRILTVACFYDAHACVRRVHRRWRRGRPSRAVAPVTTTAPSPRSDAVLGRGEDQPPETAQPEGFHEPAGRRLQAGREPHHQHPAQDPADGHLRYCWPQEVSFLLEFLSPASLRFGIGWLAIILCVSFRTELAAELFACRRCLAYRGAVGSAAQRQGIHCRVRSWVSCYCWYTISAGRMTSHCLQQWMLAQHRVMWSAHDPPH